MKYTHVLWDFNGTLLDDLAISLASADELTAKHGRKPLKSTEEYRRIFGFPITDYYRRLGFDFTDVSFDVLAHEWVASYQSRMNTAKAFPFVPTTLKAIAGMGIAQVVISSTEENMLLSQMKELGLTGFFEEICGTGNIYGGSKEGVALRWMEAHPNAVPLFVGDTCHDGEVARSIGCDVALLTCGHQCKETLEAFHPDFLLSDASEIPNLLQR